MVTTAQPVLVEVSNMLNESTADTGSKRISYFNRSVKKVLSMAKWGWEKRKGTLDTDNAVQEYDLRTEFTDYNPLKGIISVWVGGVKIGSVDADAKADVDSPSEQKFYLEGDNNTLGFIKELDGTETVDVWYYAAHTNVSSASDNLTFQIPDEMVLAISTYMKHLVHEGKRQRYDSRNALIDFKEEIDNLRPMAGTKKIKDRPKVISNIFRYNRVRRVYSTH